jgi:solute carrier family 25 carnitine/acylcarnitine transporter 20/29
MQLDNISRRQYHNSLHCLSTLLRDNGVKVLYTGFGINTFREIVYLGSYFFCYEGIRETLIQNSCSLQIAVPAAGGLAGSIGWLFSFPLDFVRARVHGQSFISGDHTCNRRKQTAITIAESLFKQKGIIGLYSGVTPSIIRAFLVSGVRFSAYELTVYLLAGNQRL